MEFGKVLLGIDDFLPKTACGINNSFSFGKAHRPKMDHLVVPGSSCRGIQTDK